MRMIENKIIAASAGTGKTFQLALRYIKLLALGVPPERVAALTFSRKAAGEILDRVVTMLCKWSLNPGRMAKEIAAAGFPSDFGPEGARDVLVKTLRSAYRLKIGTLDSFFVSVVKRFPFEFGLGYDFEMLEERFLGLAKREVLKEVMRAASPEAARAFLAEFELATFGRAEKKLVDLLGTFVDNGHDLVKELPNSEQWGAPETIWPYGLELLEAAELDARELADRFRATLDGQDYTAAQLDKWDKVLDSIATFAERQQCEDFVFSNLMPVYDELASGSVEYTITRKKRLDGPQCALLRHLLDHVLAVSLRCKLRSTQGAFGLLSLYEGDYSRMVRDSGKLTFHDVTWLLSGGGAMDKPLSQTLSEARLYIEYRMDCTLDHWLLDEFQDTSSAQWQVISNLIDEVAQDGGGLKSFFYVGDIKQAIYGWRGGDASLFGAIANHYGIEPETLAVSYRSGTEVIDTVNAVFAHLDDLDMERVGGGAVLRAAGRRFAFQPHRTARKEIAGYATLLQPDEGGVEAAAELIRGVLETIRPFDRVESSSAQETPRRLSVAVLVRSNEKGRAIANYLRAHGINAALEGSFALNDNPAVAALLSLAKLAEHPTDSFAWRHLRMTPLKDSIPASKPGLPSFAMKLLRTIHEEGFHGFVRQWGARVREKTDSPFAAARLEELALAAELFDQSGLPKNSCDFIDFVNAYSIPSSSNDNAVQVLTIHKSKGLQYDIVFLPDLGTHNLLKAELDDVAVRKGPDRAPLWALFPPKRAVLDNVDGLREFALELDVDNCYDSLCVLYVAMTRAAKALYLIVDPPPEKSKVLRASDLLRDCLAEREVTLQVGERQALSLYERGAANWFERELEGQLPPPASADGPLRLTFNRRLRKVTPSATEAYEVDAASLFSPARYAGLAVGGATHALFEQLAWAGEEALEPKGDERAVELFRAALRGGEIAAELRRPPGEVELWREKGFDIVLDGKWVSGSFDRVHIFRDAAGKPLSAIILDFKTDRVFDSAAIDAAAAKYRPQLELYRQVLSRMLRLEQGKISLRLLFLRPGRVVGW